MGLLDDAIREHLELKRRHGADPDEVARQENEALGETRRAEFARPEGAEPVAPAPVDPEPVADEPERLVADEPERLVAEEPQGVAEPDVAPPPEPELAREPPPVAEAESPIDAGDEREPFDIEAAEPAPGTDEPWLDEDRDEVPADEALDHPRTAQEPPPAEQDSSEDVLEETPDFLQETPEHDRLWFEQRPPRDFDWDK
jgi:hypothetical protein